MKLLQKYISSLETKANISPLKIGLLPQKESSFPKHHFSEAKMLVSGKIKRERSLKGEKSSLKIVISGSEGETRQLSQGTYWSYLSKTSSSPFFGVGILMFMAGFQMSNEKTWVGWVI